MAKTLKIPYAKQMSQYCGPACLEMVLRYYGIDKKQEEIAREISPIPWFGYTVKELIDYMENQGFKVELTEKSNIEELIKNVDKGIPTIIVQRLNAQTKQPHYRIVTGYTDKHITLHDPELFDATDIPKSLVNHLWDINGNKAAVTIRR